jgi:xanthine/uracil permease
VNDSRRVRLAGRERPIITRSTTRQGIGVGRPQLAAGSGRAIESSLVARIVGVVACLAVAAIHVIDQGGVPGAKDPEYVQILYYALEVAGVVVAALLLTNKARLGWFLSLGVAAGPIVGYVLSRGPGLPDYTDDIGNWTEPLGVISLVVEGILLILAAALLVRSRSTT